MATARGPAICDRSQGAYAARDLEVAPDPGKGQTTGATGTAGTGTAEPGRAISISSKSLLSAKRTAPL